MLSKSTLLKLDNFRRGAPTRVKDSGSGEEVRSPHTKRTCNYYGTGIGYGLY